MMNAKPQRNRSSEYKGVCFDKQCNRWKVRIKINGKDLYNKLFDSEIEAAKVYNIKASEYFGEFARLNLIETD